MHKKNMVCTYGFYDADIKVVLDVDLEVNQMILFVVAWGKTA